MILDLTVYCSECGNHLIGTTRDKALVIDPCRQCSKRPILNTRQDILAAIDTLLRKGGDKTWPEKEVAQGFL